MTNPLIIGKWNLVSWTRQCIEDGSISYPFGLFPKGSLEFTNNQVMVIAQKDNQTMDSVPTLNDNLSDSAIQEFSYKASYQCNQNELLIQYLECSDPSKVGAERLAQYWFDGQVTLVLHAKTPIEINGKQYRPSATFVKMVSV